jgi:hypothetical protein
LEESKSVVLLCNVATFLNTLVEAPPLKSQRIELKEDLVVHGISVVYGDIKMKISDGNYFIEDAYYN